MNTSESDYVDCVCVFLVTKCGSKCLSHRSRSSRLFVYLHVFAFLLRSHKFNYLLIKLYISNLWRIDASLTTSKIEFRRIFNEFKTAKKKHTPYYRLVIRCLMKQMSKQLIAILLNFNQQYRTRYETQFTSSSVHTNIFEFRTPTNQVCNIFRPKMILLIGPNDRFTIH